MEKTIYNEKTIKIDSDVHKALKSYQIEHGYKSLSLAIESLIKIHTNWMSIKK